MQELQKPTKPETVEIPNAERWDPNNPSAVSRAFLSREEMNLIDDYRQWKSTAASTLVFHWKRRTEA